MEVYFVKSMGFGTNFKTIKPQFERISEYFDGLIIGNNVDSVLIGANTYTLKDIEEFGYKVSKPIITNKHNIVTVEISIMYPFDHFKDLDLEGCRAYFAGKTLPEVEQALELFEVSFDKKIFIEELGKAFYI